MTGDNLCRNLKCIAGQNGGFDAARRGLIGKRNAVTITQSPICDDERIGRVGKPLFRAGYRRNEINSEPGGLKDVL